MVEEAISWGLGRERVSARVAHLLERLPAAIEAAAGDVPSAPRELVALVTARAGAMGG